jgi:hypothetical protein
MSYSSSFYFYYECTESLALRDLGLIRDSGSRFGRNMKRLLDRTSRFLDFVYRLNCSLGLRPANNFLSTSKCSGPISTIRSGYYAACSPIREVTVNLHVCRPFTKTLQVGNSAFGFIGSQPLTLLEGRGLCSKN